MTQNPVEDSVLRLKTRKVENLRIIDVKYFKKKFDQRPKKINF